MAEGINRLIMVGNLTRDPEMRQVKEFETCRITLACNREIKKRDGTVNKEVCYIDATLWGKDASFVLQNLKKGDPICLEGYLKLEKWNDKASGLERTKHVIGVERMTAIGKRSDYGTLPVDEYEEEAPSRAQSAVKSSPKTYTEQPTQSIDNDLPF